MQVFVAISQQLYPTEGEIILQLQMTGWKYVLNNLPVQLDFSSHWYFGSY